MSRRRTSKLMAGNMGITRKVVHLLECMVHGIICAGLQGVDR
jgi:hypothetical protein